MINLYMHVWSLEHLSAILLRVVARNVQLCTSPGDFLLCRGLRTIALNMGRKHSATA